MRRGRRVASGYRCRVCLQETQPYGKHCGHIVEHYPRHNYKPWEIAEMKKPRTLQPGDRLGVPAKGELFSRLVRIWEHLTVDAYEDGEIRQRSTLLFFADGVDMKCCLSDRNTGCVAFGTGETAEAACEALEEMIETDRVQWRISQSGKRKPGK